MKPFDSPRFWPGTLRSRLFLLVAIAIVPALLLQVYVSLDRQRAAQQRAEAGLLQLTQLFARSQRQNIESARDVMAALVRMPEVQALDPVPCFERLAAMRPLYPDYAGLAVFDLNGDTLCSSSGITSTINVADRLYFQRAVDTQAFAVGEFQIGRNLGRPVLAFGHPVWDAQGRLGGVLLVAIELSTLNRTAASAPLPPEAELTVVDRNGLIMVREPGAEQWIGQPLPEAALAAALRGGGAGVLEAVGPDGVRRLHGYTPIEGVPNAELYVSVSLPLAVAYAEANELLARNLSWGGGLGLLVLLVTWAWSQAFILRPVQALSATASRLRQGDLSARTGLAAGVDELSRLAGTVDEMAAALAQRTAALHAERERLAVTLAGIGDAVIATDTEGRVSFMNPVAESLTGWAAAEAAGRPIAGVFRVVHEDTRVEVESPVARVLRQGTVVGLANHSLLLTRDGREIPVDDSGAPIRDPHGALVGVVLVFRDVTARRRAEAELYAAKQLLDKTFASLDLAVFVVEPATRRIVSANPAVERIFGYRLEEVLGRSTEFVHPNRESWSAFAERVLPALAQRRLVHAELELRRKDGRLFPAEVTVTDFHDEAGQRTGVVSVVRDISERRQAEQSLQSARQAAEAAAQRLAVLSEASGELAASLDIAATLQVILNRLLPRWADYCGVFLLDEARRPVSVASGHVNPASQPLVAEMNEVYPLQVDDERNLLGRVLRTGQTVLVARRPAQPADPPAHEARLWQVVEALAPVAILGVPLEAHGRVLGALMLAMSESGRAFAEDDLPMLQELARRAAVALDNARLFVQAQRFNAQLEQRVAERTAALRASEAALRESQERLLQESAARQRAQQQLEHGREAERARISREVHDELGGTLTALKMGLYRLRRLDGLPPPAQEQLAQLAGEIDDSAQVVRRIAQELRPAVLDDFGLVAALEWQFGEFRKRSGLRGVWRCDLEDVELPSQAAIACFRIFQEALTNVARHADASQVEVTVRREADELVLQVADDGRGMPAGQAAPGRLGLVGMHERAALLAGTLEIVSAPGHGTTVTLRVPLNNAQV